MKKGDKNFDESFVKLESDVQALKDRRNLDEMVSNLLIRNLNSRCFSFAFSCGISTPRCVMPP